jgi:hypothetical protein
MERELVILEPGDDMVFNAVLIVLPGGRGKVVLRLYPVFKKWDYICALICVFLNSEDAIFLIGAHEGKQAVCHIFPFNPLQFSVTAQKSFIFVYFVSLSAIAPLHIPTVPRRTKINFPFHGYTPYLGMYGVFFVSGQYHFSDRLI